jgi:hypothetical protein
MMFRLLVFLVALTLLPTSLLAGPRALAVAPYPAAGASRQLVVADAGKTAAAVVVSGKRCKRGALPASVCGADTGLPVAVVSTPAAAARVEFETGPSPMAGLPPACLLGPPRSC